MTTPMNISMSQLRKLALAAADKAAKAASEAGIVPAGLIKSPRIRLTGKPYFGIGKGGSRKVIGPRYSGLRSVLKAGRSGRTVRNVGKAGGR